MTLTNWRDKYTLRRRFVKRVRERIHNPTLLKNKRESPHRHQRMIARVVVALSKRVGSMLALGKIMKVDEATVWRWAQPDGFMPRKHNWVKIRILWKKLKEKELKQNGNV